VRKLYFYIFWRSYWQGKFEVYSVESIRFIKERDHTCTRDGSNE